MAAVSYDDSNIMNHEFNLEENPPDTRDRPALTKLYREKNKPV